MGVPLTAVLAAVCIHTLWGGNPIAVKVGLEAVPPFWSAFVSFAIGLTCILIWARVNRVRIWPAPGEWRGLAGLSALFATQIALMNQGIERTTGGAVWAPDGLSLFYTWQDDNHRPCKIFRHVLGTDQDADELIYEEADPGFFVSVSGTGDDRFLLVGANDHQTTEVWLADLQAPTFALKCVAPRETGHEYSLERAGDHWFISTNQDGAVDFQIMRADIGREEREHWQHGTVHGHGHGHLLQRYAIEENLHVFDGIDRNTGLTDIAYHSRVIRVVAAMGGEIESDRQADLTGGQVLAIEGVGLFGGRETGVLAQSPRATGVHGGLRPTQVRREPRRGSQMIEPIQIRLGV